MTAPYVCFLSGDIRDVAETAAALHTKGIQPAVIATDAALPPYCLPAASFQKADIVLELTIGANAKRERVLAAGHHATQNTPLFSCSLVVSATEQSSWLAEPANLIGMSFLPAQFTRGLLEIAPTVYSGRAVITTVEDFVIRMGMEISVVQDRVGMVFPRVLCSLVNEAFFALTEGAADPKDIDTAMKLGTSYPHGPIEWGQAVGIRNVVAILDALYRDTGEDRYRIAPLLRQVALSQPY